MWELSHNLLSIYNCVLWAVILSCMMAVGFQYRNYLLGLSKLHKSKTHSHRPTAAWSHQWLENQCLSAGFLYLGAVDTCLGLYNSPLWVAVLYIVECLALPWPLPTSTPFPSCDNQNYVKASPHIPCGAQSVPVENHFHHCYWWKSIWPVRWWYGGSFKWSIMTGTKEEMESEPSTACVSL